MRSPLARLHELLARPLDRLYDRVCAESPLLIWVGLAAIGVAGLIYTGVVQGTIEAEAAVPTGPARVGPEIGLTDPVYITTQTGFDDLLIGCHEGVRIVMTPGGGNVPSNVSAVVDPNGCPQ